MLPSRVKLEQGVPGGRRGGLGAESSNSQVREALGFTGRNSRILDSDVCEASISPEPCIYFMAVAKVFLCPPPRSCV